MLINKEFFKPQTIAGSLLLLMAIIAIILKNSVFENWYDSLLITTASIQIGAFAINKPILLWINDGLMALFFLSVGLEIKHEILIGHLSNKKHLALPFMAATGGIIIPALIYCYFNWTDPIALRGWAIPAATDIAFAIAIITLLGDRIPNSLKTCLLTIAILDDIAAILFIALYYTKDLSLFSLIPALITLVILIMFNLANIRRISLYILVGIVLWASVLKSGVHATLAGILLAFFIPLRINSHTNRSPAHTLEKNLRPWIAYFILPLFAFANAGVTLTDLTTSSFLHPITLGIFLGLLIGKPLGVLLFSALGNFTQISKLPQNITWQEYIGMSVLTGIGFTMSLFLGTLAFYDSERQTYVRLAILTASILSGVIGYCLLKYISQIDNKK